MAKPCILDRLVRLGGCSCTTFAEVSEICPRKPGTYFSLCHKSVAPCAPASCCCNGARRLIACDHPDALGVHLKPLPAMGRSGPDLLANALIVGHDIAKAATTGNDVDTNCFAGEHRTGCTVVSGHWMLGLSTPERVMAHILFENPDRSLLLRQSLTRRRRAFNGGSVLSATLAHLNSSAQAAAMRTALGPPAHLHPVVRRNSTTAFLRSQASSEVRPVPSAEPPLPIKAYPRPKPMSATTPGPTPKLIEAKARPKLCSKPKPSSASSSTPADPRPSVPAFRSSQPSTLPTAKSTPENLRVPIQQRVPEAHEPSAQSKYAVPHPAPPPLPGEPPRAFRFPPSPLPPHRRRLRPRRWYSSP